MSSDSITLEGLKQDLIDEMDFTQEQRCGMYVQLFAGTDLWDDTEYQNLGCPAVE